MKFQEIREDCINSELHALYVSNDITSIIKSRRIRWAGHESLKGTVSELLVFDRQTEREAVLDTGRPKRS